MPFSMILWMEDRRLRGRIMDAREPETLAVVALGIGHGGSSNGTRLVMMSMLLISRPFPPKFSKPQKKSSSTRFFCSKKKKFRRAICHHQSRFFRVLITPNPVFSTRKVCVQRHPERATRGRQIHGFCVGISTFQVTDRSLKLVVS